MTTNARSVCEALSLDAGTLADLFSREAARELRAVAAQLEEPNGDVPQSLERARHWLMLADEFEAEWERSGGDSVDDTKSEANPTATPRVAAVAESTR